MDDRETMDEARNAPLFVWDASAPGYGFGAQREAAFKWAQRHCGADNDTYRIEFYLIDDAPVARVFRYARDERGRLYPATLGGDRAAELEPVMVPLSDLPPYRL